MRIAILCPGPSLRWAPRGRIAGYDRRIAVNRAGLAFACEYWSAADWTMPGAMTLLPGPHGRPPEWFVSLDQFAKAREALCGGSGAGEVGLPARFHHTIFDVVPEHLNWATFSTTAAIALGVALASRSEAFGPGQGPQARNNGLGGPRTAERPRRPHSQECMGEAPMPRLLRDLCASAVNRPRIEIWGCDWEGTLDFDGQQPPDARREPARWVFERRIAAGLCRWALGTRGIEIVRCRPGPLYVSFWCGPGYAAQAQQLAAGLRLLGIEHRIDAEPDPGNWQAATQHKAIYIGRMLDEHPGRAIAWLDADARVLKRPELIDAWAAGDECDFAAVWRDGTELLSSTMLFAPTPRARELVRRWERRNAQNPAGRHGDQANLQDIIERDPPEGLRVRRLPGSYALIEDLMAGQVPAGEEVIVQTQASRRLRR